ncbi:MAG: YitT family protein [Firmicutes bacterium]|nr:YitT family protein [Bacillota bacterium]
MWPFKKKKVISDDIIKEIYAKYRVKRYIELIIGVLLIAIAFNTFLLPNNIVFGGVSGFSVITQYLFNIDPSIFIMIVSLLLLVISYFVLGKETTARSILGSILFPLFVNITSDFNTFINVGDELLLATVFGGVIYGFGLGLVFKAGYTTGGTDIINQILSKYLKISMGNAMLICDGLIVLAGAFVFGITKSMYAIIVIYLISLLADKVLLGISDSKAFYIITEHEDIIKDYILNQLGHGVTIFDAKGGFTKEKQKMLLCVVPTKEYYKLKTGIHELDNKAFFVVTDAYEVFGGE